jgi:hypothetical protein
MAKTARSDGCVVARRSHPISILRPLNLALRRNFKNFQKQKSLPEYFKKAGLFVWHKPAKAFLDLLLFYF